MFSPTLSSSSRVIVLVKSKTRCAEVSWHLWEKQEKLHQLAKIWGFEMLIGDNDASSFKPSEISDCQETHALALEFKSMEDR